MQIYFKTVNGVFLARPNRFMALVETAGSIIEAHIATSGRLKELLIAGADVLLEPRHVASRRTPFNLLAVNHRGTWVSIDATIPNRLLGKAFREGKLPSFTTCNFMRSEPVSGAGRLDFLLEQNGLPVYIEVKSVTLVQGRVALFPDAPTERGSRHLRHLAELAAQGNRSAVIFVVQRQDADSFAPNAALDPGFTAALRDAAAAGVEIHAHRCIVMPESIRLAGAIAVMTGF